MLSGGERARALLARPLAGEAQILLADEPFAQLDPGHQLHAMDVLRAAAGAGALVVVVLHDLSIAARHCSRIVLLSQGRIAADGAPTDVLKGGLCISGIYDLKPVRLSSRSAYLKISEPVQEELSPIRHVDKLRSPLVVAYGTDDSPEFKRQGREFAAAVKTASKPVEALVGQHYNHFELLETLGNPYGLLGRAVLNQMKLA
jgi:ABC-type multidrug transport system ATPase subunit